MTTATVVLRYVILILALMAAWPAAALARNPALDKARIAVDRYDLEAALALLPRALAEATSAAEQTEVLLLTAELELTCDRPARAREAFRELLRRFPDFRLPANGSPKLMAELELVLSEQMPVPPVAPADGATSSDTPPQPGDTPALLPELPVISPVTNTGPVFYETWWFWGSVGVVAASVIGILAWQVLSPDPPQGDLGPYRMR
jgi:hypothetical protein